MIQIFFVVRTHRARLLFTGTHSGSPMLLTNEGVQDKHSTSKTARVRDPSAGRRQLSRSWLLPMRLVGLHTYCAQTTLTTLLCSRTTSFASLQLVARNQGQACRRREIGEVRRGESKTADMRMLLECSPNV